MRNEHIREVDRYNRSVLQWVRNVERLRHSSDEKAERPIPPLLPTWVDEYEQENHLRRVSVTQEGIRFFVTFDRPRKPLRFEEYSDVTCRLRELCIAVARQTLELGDSTTMPQISLYAGTGITSDFLIMCRAPDRHFL